MKKLKKCGKKLNPKENILSTPKLDTDDPLLASLKSKQVQASERHTRGIR